MSSSQSSATNSPGRMIVNAPKVSSARIIGAYASPSALHASSRRTICSSLGGRVCFRPSMRRLSPSKRFRLITSASYR